MARKASQSYFSSGLGFSGEDRFAKEAGLSSATGVNFSPSTEDVPASPKDGNGKQSKETEFARAPFASRPTQAGVRRGPLNSRFAVKSSAKGLTPSQQLRGSSANGTAEQVSKSSSFDGPQGRKLEPGEDQRPTDEGRRQGFSEGFRFGVSGKRGQLSGRADPVGDDLQTKRAAAAAAGYTASLQGTHGTVKSAPRVGRVDTRGQASGATGLSRPAVSKSTLFQKGVLGDSSVESARTPEVPSIGRDAKVESFVFGAGLGAPKSATDIGSWGTPVSSTSEGLESIRNVYGGAEKAAEPSPGRDRVSGKRMGASGISSFLDLNSPPFGEATFFDAFADAAAGSLGGEHIGFAKQQRRTTNGSVDRSATFGVEGPAEFSRFLEQAFGLSPLGSTQEQQPEGVNGPQDYPQRAGVNPPPEDTQVGVIGPPAGVYAPQTGVNAPQAGLNQPQGREPRRRPFATMYRQKQAENLAQGLGKLNLSKQAEPQRSADEASAKTQPTGAAVTDNGSFFQTAPEVLFKAPPEPSSAFGVPKKETSAKGESQEKHIGGGIVGGHFVLFGAPSETQPQPQPQPQPQAPSLFQTPPEVLFGHRSAPSGIDSGLSSPAFSQSPKVDAEKPKAAPPQGILPFVFSAGSSGGSAKSGGRSVPDDGDSWHLNQSFTERLHLAEIKTQGEKPSRTASSLEGSGGFHFQGSVSDKVSTNREVFGENPPKASATSAGAPALVNSPPVSGGGVPGVTGSPLNPGFVAFGTTEGSPGTPAKRKSEQKLAKKASPGGRNGFTSTRTLQRTPPAKPPIPASPGVPVTHAGNGVSKTGSSDQLGENEWERVESPQPMDISPGRECSESAAQEGPAWEHRGVGSGAAASGVRRAEPGVKPVAGDSWQSATGVSVFGAEPRPSGRFGEAVNPPKRAANVEHENASASEPSVNGPQISVNGPQVNANGPQARAKRSQGRVNGRLGGVNGRFGGVNGRFGGVNGPQLSASYDGDSEEGNSSFEESESDKRAAEGGSAWTGKWSPPKEPYEYDSSESESQSEAGVNPEAWVKGEKQKLERLKKTEGAGGGDLGDSGFESVWEDDSAVHRAQQVETLGADVLEMDLGSVEDPGGGLESDGGNEAESAATFSEAVETPPTGVNLPSSKPFGEKESGDNREGVGQGAWDSPPIGVPQENGPAKAKMETVAAKFVFGAGKPGNASVVPARNPKVSEFSSAGPAPPVAPAFVFTSGPTMPKSPKRSSTLRRSTDRIDPLRRSTDSGRRKSLEKGKALNRSVDESGGAGMAGVPVRCFPPGPDERPGGSAFGDRGFFPGVDGTTVRPPEPAASQSSTGMDWGQSFKSARFTAASQPAFPSPFTPSPAISTNPFAASSPNPTFQGSPIPSVSDIPTPSFPSTASFPTSPYSSFSVPPNPGFGNPASSGKPDVPASEPASTGSVPAAKTVRKARRFDPNKARQSWESQQTASPLGGVISKPGSAPQRIASPEAMDDESNDAKLQGGSSRKPSRSHLYDPESAMSYAQFFCADGGASTPVTTSETNGVADAQPQTTPTAAKAARAGATCERWRLKGNQAYATKDYRGAEALYTKGVDAVTSSNGHLHEGCEEAAAVCLSNRAAVRMALGRVREALSDCRRATAANPDFTKVRLRAANCHVMLGEFGTAQAVFTECAEHGGKVAAEANEGLARASELSTLTLEIAELLDCPELLGSSSQSADATSNGHVSQPEAASGSEILARPFRQVSAIRAAEAQKLLTDALVAAPHSEPLLQMRALSLLWTRSFDETVAFCTSSLTASELNARIGADVARGAAEQAGSNGLWMQSDGLGLGSDGNWTGVEGVRLWRWRVSALAQYHLGKVEEADELAGKVEAMTGVGTGAACGAATEETLGGLRTFIKDLQKHKAAGNAAFQSGRREVAIEHYSAALGCNSSSRPFNAVCLANRAAAYQALGSFAEAIADCSRAIVLDPGYAKALSRRATLHDLIRDHSESVRDLERLSGLLTARQSSGQRDPQLAQEVRAVADRKRKAQEAAQKEVPVDHYKVLGVEKDGGEAEVKKAYRKAALRHHPDKAVQFLSMLKDEEKAAVTEEIHSEAERLFKLIGEAYNVLSNPSKRMAYDADEEDRSLRTSVRPFGRSSRSQGFPRSTGGRSSWTNVRRPFDSEWAEDFFGRKGRSTSKSRGDDHTDYYWDADFY